MVENIEEYDVDISGVMFYQFDQSIKKGLYKGPETIKYERSEVWKFRAMMLSTRMYDNIYYPFSMCFWGKLFKASIFGNKRFRFKKGMKKSEDLLLMQQILADKYSLFIDSKELYGYRINPNSVTHVFDSDYLKEKIRNIDILENAILFDHQEMKDAFCVYKICSLVDIGKNYIANKNNHASYKIKKNEMEYIIESIKLEECSNYIDTKYVTKFQYIYLVCLKNRYLALAIMIAKFAAFLG